MGASRWATSVHICALALATAVSFPAVASAEIPVIGTTEVTFGWAPAEGPVAGYYVFVARNGDSPSMEAATLDTRETLSAEYGDFLTVQVAAFDAMGVVGPLSLPSETIEFLERPTDPAPEPRDPGTPDDEAPPDAPVAAPRGDVTGDGLADLVVRTGDDLTIWEMNGAEVARVIALPAAPDGSDVVGTGDYDGNGAEDLLFETRADGALELWLLDGGVVTDTRTLDRHTVPEAEGWQVRGSGDFDGDGAAEILLSSRVRGEAALWRPEDPAPDVIDGHTGAWSVAALDDLDATGRDAIVWLDELDRSLEVQDTDTSTRLPLGTLEPEWRVAASADLDGDGAAELLTRHAATDAVRALELDAAGTLHTRGLPDASELGSSATTGDFDGDGREDIAWSDATSPVVTLWLASDGASVEIRVDRELPPGGEVVSAGPGADDAAFRDRFCFPDLSRNDTSLFRSCSGAVTHERCEAADLDGDGRVTDVDATIWQLRADGHGC